MSGNVLWARWSGQAVETCACCQVTKTPKCRNQILKINLQMRIHHSLTVVQVHGLRISDFADISPILGS